MKHATKTYLSLRYGLLIIGLGLVLAIASGCADDEKKSIPARPRFVSKSTDTAYYDMGIRPMYGTQGIYLEWYPNTEEDLAGYKLYRSTETSFIDGQEVPVNFSLVKEIPLGSQKNQGLPDTVYQDINVDLDTPYYYRLSAYSRSGGESVTSSEDPNYELRSLPDGLDVKSGGQTATILPFPHQDSTLTFTWTPRGSATGGKYIIKIYEYNENTGEAIIVAWAQITGGYVAGEPISLSIKFSPIGQISPNVANDGRILNLLKIGDQTYGRQYYWRVYYVEAQSGDLITLKGAIAEGTFNLGD